MLTANLLPPEEKDIIAREETSRLISFFTIGIIVILAAGAVLLLPSYLPLFLERRELSRALLIEEETAERLNIQAYGKEIEHIKTLIRSLTPFSEKESRASKLLEKIFLYAKGISIQSLDVRKTGEISLQGRAETRQNLLLFERALQNSELFDTISLPLSQIIRETDISFNLSGTVKEGKGL